MNILCGYFQPTKGTAKVMGFDVRNEISDIHMLLGVCPQVLTVFSKKEIL